MKLKTLTLEDIYALSDYAENPCDCSFYTIDKAAWLAIELGDNWTGTIVDIVDSDHIPLWCKHWALTRIKELRIKKLDKDVSSDEYLKIDELIELMEGQLKSDHN